MEELIDMFGQIALAALTSITPTQEMIDEAGLSALRTLEDAEVREYTDNQEWGTGTFKVDWIRGEVQYNVPWEHAPSASCHADPASVDMEWAAAWFDRATWSIFVNCERSTTMYDLEAAMAHEYWHWAQHVKVQMILDKGTYNMPELASHFYGIVAFMDGPFANGCFAAMEATAYMNDAILYPDQTMFIGWSDEDGTVYGEELGRMLTCAEGSEDKVKPFDGEDDPLD